MTMTAFTQPAAVEAGGEADLLAEAAYDRLLRVLDGLDANDWTSPTECHPWSVRDMVAHMAGAAEGHASLPVMVRQMIRGQKLKSQFEGNSLDAMNEAQIRSQAGQSGPEITDHLRALVPGAIRGRRRRARWGGFIPVPIDATGSTAGFPSRVSMGRLCAVVLTRDVWMHRFDIHRAIGSTPTLDEVDARLVADVVTEWQGQHGQPVRLELTGPAGGSYRWGANGRELRVDAIDFCRILAGRRPATDVPADVLLDVRLLF